MKDILISHESLQTFCYVLFSKIGIPKRIYSPVVDGLIHTSLRGVDSHGVRLIPHYVRAAILGRINKNAQFSFKKTSSATGVLNADHGYGIAAGITAMKKAIQLAGKSGMGAIAVKNSSHFGTAAIYSLLAASQNMIGVSFTHTDALVLPFGGKKPFLGTNPLCFAAPCEGEEPFCFDMATSQIPWNKVLVHRAQKKKLKPDWAADANGNPCEDPKEAMALLPAAGYKGYGLALMIEILCSVLTGMSYGPHIRQMYPLDPKKRYLGHFFIAIDIAKFQEVQSFKRRLKNLMDELRSQPTVLGVDRVRIPGDPEKEIYKIRKKIGIPISEHDFSDLRALAIEVGLKQKKFNFP